MSAAPPSAPTRLTSVDAYRGLVMFLMLAEVLQLRKVANAVKDNELLNLLAKHQTHVEWAGCTLHDLIQPSFSFLVGTALALSLAARSQAGQSTLRMTLHAFFRAAVLVFLGVFLRSLNSNQTNFVFVDTLSQIGLGYGLLFLLALRPFRDRLLAFLLILVGYWALFALWPLPGENFDWKTAGADPNWVHNFTGFAAHWNKNYGPTWAFDHWFLNLFPREKPFLNDPGGYGTLSFIPTLATMLLGHFAGNILVHVPKPDLQLRLFAGFGMILLAIGLGLHYSGYAPCVKRIWTPTWVIFSGGWCFLLLSFFVTVTDWLCFKAWCYPLIVIGANSIAAYCMSWLFKGFFLAALNRHLGPHVFQRFGPEYEPLLQGGAVLLIFWLILFWMYRKKILIKI